MRLNLAILLRQVSMSMQLISTHSLDFLLIIGLSMVLERIIFKMPSNLSCHLKVVTEEVWLEVILKI
jgi:hypothetical protein